MTDDHYDDDLWEDPDDHGQEASRGRAGSQRDSAASDGRRRRGGPPPRRSSGGKASSTPPRRREKPSPPSSRKRDRSSTSQQKQRSPETSAPQQKRRSPEPLAAPSPAESNRANEPDLLEDELLVEDEFEEYAPPKGPRWLLVGAVLLLIVGAFVGAGIFLYERVVDPLSKPTSTTQVTEPEEVVRVLIPEGLTVTEIEGRISGAVPRFTVEELDKAIASGEVKSSLKPVDSDSWEGIFFPATYEVGSRTTPVEFLNDLASTMEQRMAALNPEESLKTINERYNLSLDEYDLLTVASLVQAEAGNAEEAPKIASVIYNRLEKDSTAWTLGIDASDEYGAELEGMSPAEYRETDGPYNLRKVAGLPPTPISAPGDYALEAALAPEDTEFMYYVLSAPGIHTFVVTDAEFQQAKAECRRAGLGCG